MSWIDIDSDLVSHPKLVIAARVLQCEDSDLLVGKLLRLWSWAAVNAPDGDITDVSADYLAVICNWQGEPELFRDALLTCGSSKKGFIEQTGEGRVVIHDWGKHIASSISRARAKYSIYNINNNNTSISSSDDSSITAKSISKARSKKSKAINISSSESESLHSSNQRDLVSNETKLCLFRTGHYSNQIYEVTEKNAKYQTPKWTDCWEAYPRKVNKPKAEEAYKAAVRAGGEPREIFNAVMAYAGACLALGTETGFIMHGSTFFHERWREWIPPDGSAYVDALTRWRTDAPSEKRASDAKVYEEAALRDPDEIMAEFMVPPEPPSVIDVMGGEDDGQVGLA